MFLFFSHNVFLLSIISEILDGNVFFFNNNLLCFENTINWKDIFSETNLEVIFQRSSKDPVRECEFHSFKTF